MATLGVPGSNLLAPSERRQFVVEFEQDLEFFRLLLLLFNKACPIRNLDLVWSEQEASGRFRVRHLGTTEALTTPWSRLLRLYSRNPHPEFCNIINDWGRREADSCAISDKAAEDVVRRTGQPYVYQCRFGLTDIAVPVVAGGEHIATLFTGQVLREPPSAEGFARVARAASRLGYVDLARLEEAYWKLPVVSEEDVRNTVGIVQAFAKYLGISWLRLRQIVREQRRRERELALARKEFAYLALEGVAQDRAEIKRLARQLGLSRLPNRVLVVKVQAGSEVEQDSLSHEVESTSALQAVEEVCEAQENATCARLPSRGICIFFHDPQERGSRLADMYARSFASRVLHSIRERCTAGARVGVGGRHWGWEGLRKSYQEACAALARVEDEIALSLAPEPTLEELYRMAWEIPRMLLAGHLGQARACVASLSVLAGETDAAAADPRAVRLFLSSALQSICLAARELGCQKQVLETIQQNAVQALANAGHCAEIEEAWRNWALAVIDEVALLRCGRRKKIVERACRFIEQHVQAGTIPQQLSAKTIAARLGVSLSHFSRIFKRETGQTFETYLIGKRVELAKRLLLDPTYSVCQVAERCGYRDASYLAKVFRKAVGCTPSQFCQDPCLQALAQPTPCSPPDRNSACAAAAGTER